MASEKQVVEKKVDTKTAVEETVLGLDVDIDDGVKIDPKLLITVTFIDHTKTHPNKVITIPLGFPIAESSLIRKTYENHYKEFGLTKPFNIDITTSDPHGVQWNAIPAIETYWRIHAGQHPKECVTTVREDAKDQPAGCIPRPIHHKNIADAGNDIPDKRDIPFMIGGKVAITDNEGKVTEQDWPGIKAYGQRLGLVHELADSANYLGMVPLTHMAAAMHASSYMGVFDKETQALIKAVENRTKSYEYVYTKGDGLIEEKDYIEDDDDDDEEEKKGGEAATGGEPAAAAAAPAAPAVAAPAFPAMPTVPTIPAPTTQEEEDEQLATAMQASTVNDPEDVD